VYFNRTFVYTKMYLVAVRSACVMVLFTEPVVEREGKDKERSGNEC